MSLCPHLLQVNDGSAEKPYHMSKDLAKIINNKKTIHLASADNTPSPHEATASAASSAASEAASNSAEEAGGGAAAAQ
jgi:hypothetical protein